MPRHDDAPRDLLFGLLALQNGLISRDQLVTAFALWTASDGRPMADLLADQCEISRSRIEGFLLRLRPRFTAWRSPLCPSSHEC